MTRDTESSLLCSAPGCMRRWTSNFGRRLCSSHTPSSRDPQLPLQSSTPLPLPLRKAVRSFAEPVEPDEEYVHDDRA